MPEKIKKKQHYIWRHYLKPWTNDNKIWCKIGNRIFQTSPVNIGAETYFYEAHELNELEKYMILSYIKRTPAENHAILIDSFDRYNFYSIHSNETKKSGLEDYHNFIENNAISILDKVYKRDLSFLRNNDKNVKFSYYLGLQYMKTKKMLKSYVGIFDAKIIPDEYKGKFDPEKVGKVYGILLADCMGNWIHSRGQFYFYESEYELIASDQPIINIRANYLSATVNRIELYYPLTPYLALFISDKKLSDRILKKEDALFFNNQMRNKSHEQIYSLCREQLAIL